MSNKDKTAGNKDNFSSASEKSQNGSTSGHVADNNAKTNAQPKARPGIPFVTCPACNTGDLCPRRRSSLKDWLAWMVGLTPYRCNRCNERCYRR